MTIRNKIPHRFIAWMIFFSVFGVYFSAASKSVTKEIQEPKKFKLELTLEEVNNTIFIMENSTAAHNVVTSLIKNIADQVNKQLAEDKKITDSLNKNKKNQP